MSVMRYTQHMHVPPCDCERWGSTQVTTVYVAISPATVLTSAAACYA